jgi:hypothetical protein
MRGLVLGCLLVCVACGGGSSDSRPAKLSTRLNDDFIAQVAMDQRQAMVQAQTEWNTAKMQSGKSEADWKRLGEQITVVKNDREKAKLQLSSARSTKDAADKSADSNKINDATRELHTAELAMKAADARLAYFEKYRAYLQLEWRWAEEAMYWREAQYELAKAQTAQKNNIAPKGVDYAAFAKQEQDRNQRAAAAKSKAESEKTRAQSARESWVRAQQTADQATGTPSSFPDPMQAQPTASSH